MDKEAINKIGVTSRREIESKRCDRQPAPTD
jgi:hypothetical protein